MKHLAIVAALALAPLAALAEQPVAGPPAPVSTPTPPTTAPDVPAPSATAAPAYAVPVETFRITGADAKMFEMGEAAGGYSVLYRGGQGWSSRIGTQGRSSYRNIFRFTDSGGVELLTGVCRIRTEGQSLFGVSWNQRSSQLYACEIKDKPADRYSLEVIVPAFKQGGFSIGGLTVEASEDIPDAELQAVLRAKMVFDGVAYEATPTAFARRPVWDRRVVQGYTITRDGALVGRIDFGSDNTLHRGAITAPSAEGDGRQAVLFFAHQLSIMPDLYSSVVREEVFP
ncbi:MAG: hypothetical protein IV086_01380 [Hyphomonadaceae bacterium]|nr:MAG: hypothetical protein FD160_3051 [Caulobacteraceae bacterium]MBT9444329.1 hypothetical protein [Hyphomonadaceae bacterium]TPW02490.1 MAG: hypothetical protein FD124_3375 [Alphaproteobacteria bacterium]